MKYFFESKGQVIRLWRGNSLEFGAHLHTHIELVYLLEGRARVTVDALETEFAAGDLLLVFPNQIHQYFNVGPQDYLIATLPPGICPEYESILMRKVPLDPVLRGASSRAGLVAQLWRALELAADEGAPLWEARLRGHFLVILGEVLGALEYTGARPADSDTVKAVLSYCLERYTGPIALEDVSAALHLNKYYISHLFPQKLHMKFGDYIASLRVSRACELLCEGRGSITDIAYQVGFNSPRSFNRSFLRQTGVTPRAYRNAGPAAVDGTRTNRPDSGEDDLMAGPCGFIDGVQDRHDVDAVLSRGAAGGAV